MKAGPDARLRVEQSKFPACSGLDDDRDGVIDDADRGCFTPYHDDETDPIEQAECSNGMDDDEDGRIDFPEDIECDGAAGASESVVCEDEPTPFLMKPNSAVYGLNLPANDEGTKPSCGSNGRNRGSAILPLAEESLVEVQLWRPTRFVNGYAALLNDCGETFCQVPAAPTQVIRVGQLEAGEYHLLMGTTDLTDDNDVNAHVYIQPIFVECSDGVDNDGDGQVDGDDLDCTWGRDRSEAGSGPRAECNDGLDNDGDGQIDYPEDEGCDAAGDDYEATCAQSPVARGRMPRTRHPRMDHRPHDAHRREGKPGACPLGRLAIPDPRRRGGMQHRWPGLGFCSNRAHHRLLNSLVPLRVCLSQRATFISRRPLPGPRRHAHA